MTKFIITNINHNGSAIVTLNRPDLHNAFNAELIDELKKTFIELGQNLNVRLVVLTGAGKSFCAGADLNWMKSMISFTQEENYEDSLKLAEMFKTLNDFPKPVIGKINGSALGGGSGLVAICDYALVSSKAFFGFTEVRLGLVPAVISPYVIDKIGESFARAWFLSGEKFSGAQALQMGLVHQISEPENLDAACDSVVQSFLQAGPEASMGAKKMIREILDFDDEQVRMQHACKTISRLRVSREGQEGMNAMLNKTKPSWLK